MQNRKVRTEPIDGQQQIIASGNRATVIGGEVADGYQTSLPGILAAGDVRRGQPLVAWATKDGVRYARAIDALMGHSDLPR